MQFYMKLPSASAILISLYVFLSLCTTRAAIKLPENGTVSAVFVFGDSILDTGNNNNLITLIKGNFPPYGRDFMGGIPTGRFSNGKVPSDLIAKELRIKEFLPAYLSPNLQTKDLATGVCFASAGSGYDTRTAKKLLVLSLPTQLELFKEYIVKLRRAVGEERAESILSSSLFLVSAGNNDIGITYILGNYDPSYTSLLVGRASSFLKELHGLGARRIAVLSTFVLGCEPLIRTLFGGIERECAENLNQAAQLFNTELSSELDHLNSNLPQARLVYIDVYNPLVDLEQNPNKYGFEVVSKGCRGTGLVEFVGLCNELNPFTCADVNKHVFWDSLHPTERAYKFLVSHILQKCVSAFFCDNSPC